MLFFIFLSIFSIFFILFIRDDRKNYTTKTVTTSYSGSAQTTKVQTTRDIVNLAQCSNPDNLFVKTIDEINATPATVRADRSRPLLRIFGGSVVEEDKYPFIGILTFKNALLCACTLIHRKWALSAAHCVNDIELYATFAKVDINKFNQNTVKRRVKRQIVHPDYNSETYVNDICLFELEDPIETIRPICISPSDLTFPSSQLTVAGWGFTETDQKSNQLLESRVLKLQTCPWNINKNSSICAGYKSSVSATCFGDSGGPMFFEHPILGYIQVGIVSFGSAVCGVKPGVFTRVSHYYDWILSHITSF